jgi:hypothetical protein
VGGRTESKSIFKFIINTHTGEDRQERTSEEIKRERERERERTFKWAI